MISAARPSNGAGSLLGPIVILAAVWALVVVIVNPLGEFMVNDDWSYVRALELLRSEGSLGSTGWGPGWARGGPALLTHLLWGWLFTAFTEFSLATLRLAVVAAGFLGSVAMLGVLQAAKVPRWVALFGALTLVMNPLFLSQTFTFMTDVTFTCLVVFSLWALYAGVRSGKKSVITLGLFFALCSILTRQIGLIVPAAFLFACWLHPRGKELGRAYMVGLVFAVTILPWIAFEYLLFHVDSTPITEHQVVVGAWTTVLRSGVSEYLVLVLSRIVSALVYGCVLVSPVLALSYAEIAASRAFRFIFAILTLGFLIFEGLLIGGAVDVTVAFLPNVITDFGIGPLLMKDTYILGIQRLAGIPKPLYCALVYGALVSVVAWAVLLVGSVTRSSLLTGRSEGTAADFLALLSLLSGLLYLFVIGLTGFHDRYLIPMCMMLIIWSITHRSREHDPYPTASSLAPGLVPLILMVCFAVPAEHDFLEMKRAQAQAHHYLLHDLRADPCRCDGGMEFNGYHCYKPDLTSAPGLSWWWVSTEDYVVTLGPLDGYEVIRTFPFRRYLGTDGAVYLLKPSASEPSARPFSWESVPRRCTMGKSPDAAESQRLAVRRDECAPS